MQTATQQTKHKLSHSQVDYEHPAKGAERCAGCKHYLPGKPPHCEDVKDPIRPEDWCRRFEQK
jgi:hypothetical protein